MTTPRSEARPTRTCIGCRTALPQGSMVRCALGNDGVVRVGRTAPGRGAWLCSAACFTTAEKRKAFDRAWRRQMPAGALEVVREAFPRSNDRMNVASTTGRNAAPSTPTKG